MTVVRLATKAVLANAPPKTPSFLRIPVETDCMARLRRMHQLDGDDPVEVLYDASQAACRVHRVGCRVLDVSGERHWALTITIPEMLLVRADEVIE
jgi:hypothetical protein